MARDKMPRTYRWLVSYMRYLYEKIFFKDVYYLNTQYVPTKGTPVLVVSDYQNSINDAISILLSFRDRRVIFLARKGAFAFFPLLEKFLCSIGVIKSFQRKLEGEGYEKADYHVPTDVEKALVEGDAVSVFPEAVHQGRHFLGAFSLDYVRMAFEAAEKENFEKDICILPACNHYSEYSGLRNQALVEYGEPISLMPFYDQYRSFPDDAIENVNKSVRGRVQRMMLHIGDVGNYEAIDFIRQGDYGCGYAKAHGYDPGILPQKLSSDKKLVSTLENVSDQDLYDDALKYKGLLRDLGFSEKCYDEAPRIQDVVVKCIGMVIILPLAVFCAWPALPAYFIPRLVSRKIGDKIFSGAFSFLSNALFIFPILGMLTLVLGLPARGVVQSIVWVVLFPYLCMFEWKYFGWAGQVMENIHYLKHKNSIKFQDIKTLRDDLFTRLDKVLI